MMNTLLWIAIIFISTICSTFLLNILSNWSYDWLLDRNFIPEFMTIKWFFLIFFILVLFSAMPEIIRSLDIPLPPFPDDLRISQFPVESIRRVDIKPILWVFGLLIASVVITQQISIRKLPKEVMGLNVISRDTVPYLQKVTITKLRADNWKFELNNNFDAFVFVYTDFSVRLMTLVPYRNYRMKIPRKRISKHVAEMSRNISDLKISASGRYISLFQNSEQLLWDGFARKRISLSAYEEIARGNEIHSFNTGSTLLNKTKLISPNNRYELVHETRNYFVENRVLLFFKDKKERSYTTLVLREIASQRGLNVYGLPKQLHLMAFSCDGSVLAYVTDYDSRSVIRFYDTDSWVQLPYLLEVNKRWYIGKLARIYKITFNPSGTLLIAFVNVNRLMSGGQEGGVISQEMHFWKVP